MQVPRRYSVRWLMGAVAVVALVFGLAIELRTRRERDLAADAEAEDRNRAAWHREQAVACDRAIGQGEAYRIKQRDFLLRRSASVRGLTADADTFDNWAGERDYHRYRAATFEAEAETFAEKRRAAHRRLLLSF